MVGLRVGQTGTKTFRDPPGLTRVRETDKWLRLVTKTATCLPTSNHKVDVTTANMDDHKYIRDTVQLVCSLQGLQPPGSAEVQRCGLDSQQCLLLQRSPCVMDPGLRHCTQPGKMQHNETQIENQRARTEGLIASCRSTIARP